VNMSYRRCFEITFLLLFSLEISSSSGASDLVTRYVEEVQNGRPTAFAIQRDSRELAPQNGLPLQGHDCVVLRSAYADSAATLVLIIDGHEIHVDQSHKKYCLGVETSHSAAIDAIAHTFVSLIRVFQQADHTYNARPLTPTVSRGGEPPAMLLLYGDSQRIAAGRRTLALTWSGGTPPFTIRLVGPHTMTRLPDTVTSNDWTARVDSFGYEIGRYQITVRDATGNTVNGRFTVVDVGSLPVPSAETETAIKSPSTPPSLAAALDAARLMADVSGSWRFEAYQRVIRYERGSVLARRLVYELQTDG
jgi:hypothetical protein